MLGKRIGVDLGTANVLIYVKGRGIVIAEPSVVAVAQRDNSIVAVGTEAREMLGRTPGSISVVRPMRDGVIADYVTTEAMLRYFIRRVMGRISMIKPEVMICVPAGVTGVEQRAVQDAAEAAGARRPAHLIPEPLAAAIGARIPVHIPQGHMVVDIGGGRTEAAVISMYGIVVSESVRVAGDRLDDAIAAYIKRRHNLVIGDRTAEELKIAIGSALPLEEEITYQVRGRDQITGLPRTITVTSSEVTQAMADPLQSIVGAARAVLERTPPELASDVVDRGIVLSGGTGMLRNLDRLITQEIGIPCYVADSPMECVAMGAGIALEHLDLIKRAQPAEGEWLVSL
ncbi:MAG: rod shape-determining protein [Chloroflexi bacterium]|nr:rod shape-determining protein [Chloroflexota bacterium]MCI0784167.1 rod shape-determining protein [Chloroflexota bacterium]MCI0813672.1 rod shape-determining protein [Chloroflexota bacterium]MCI0818413.1 rod shape-determining protein [Chloroflexota bacterium]MCI0819183.1 rod shape-determining protein [Chloroflexota bacterium]